MALVGTACALLMIVTPLVHYAVLGLANALLPHLSAENQDGRRDPRCLRLACGRNRALYRNDLFEVPAFSVQ
jgi:hypothetical protein